MRFEKVSYEQFKKDLLEVTKELSEENIEEIYNNIELPTRSTGKSAGYDFKIPYAMILFANNSENIILPTGIKCQLDDNKVLLLMPRSSLGLKHGFTLPNTIGVIDADYYNNPNNEGHIKWSYKVNHNITLDQGDKYMQGVIVSYYTTDDDSTTGVRTGGIGSTGA